MQTFAIDIFSQGLCMFDAGQRLIICNDRYQKIYGLTPEQVRPGTPLKTILEYRIANGLFAGGSPADYMLGVLQNPFTRCEQRAC